jgi:riboflavin synthase
MFSGIIEEVGVVVDVHHTTDKSTIVIQVDTCFVDVIVGDSISVNGVCLTVCERRLKSFVFEAMPETVRLTSLGSLMIGGFVNIERAMNSLSRIGGHIVQGHIDGTTTIKSIEHDGCALKIWFKKLDAYSYCFIPKGYIGIDGMSLTIVDVIRDSFSICIIPHTQRATIVKYYHVGMKVNIEIDHIFKTIALILNTRELDCGKHC